MAEDEIVVAWRSLILSFTVHVKLFYRIVSYRIFVRLGAASVMADFRFEQFKDGGRGHLGKISNGHIPQRLIRST